jgi:uracil-DNA glycosylase
MKFETLTQLVGESWAGFLKTFMCPDPQTGVAQFDTIEAQLKDKYKSTKVFPSMKQVFRCFKETPFESLRVIIIGQDPYFKEGIANGIAFASDAKEYKGIPPALRLIYDAIEKDVYNGLDIRKASRNGTLGRPDDAGIIHSTWMQQGVLMLNSALTVEEKIPNSHMEIWHPFMQWFVDNIWRVKRSLIICAWGGEAKKLIIHRPAKTTGQDMLDTGHGVNIFFAFPLMHEHPSIAGRENRPWLCTHFSHVNNIIKINHLGKPIEW